MFKKIIVALDTTENYVPLFNKALSLAQITGAELGIVNVLRAHYDHVMPFGSYPISAGYSIGMEDGGDGYLRAYQQEYTNLKEAAFRLLSELSNQGQAKGVPTKFFQKNGEPGTVICDLASSEQADLVMVGSHKRRGLEELLVGSVSSYVMHRAPCSVMVVHQLAQAKDLSQQAVMKTFAG